jgi:predicted dehydrogenase
VKPSARRPPRLAFVGLGWAGALRLASATAAGAAEAVALCETVPERLEAARADYPDAACFEDPEDLWRKAAALDLDGVVVATPNALHAPQVLPALERGLAVFCQKPLALSAGEARQLVSAAREADRLLGVDYSYRFTLGAQEMRRAIDAGELGRVVALSTVFHNAYGPDKAWFRDPALAGGGALLDLGVHLIDLALWLTEARAVAAVAGRATAAGRPVAGGPGARGIDDFAAGWLEIETGAGERATASLAVSWNAHAGEDATIRAAVFGTGGGAELRNVDGGFYDFELRRHRGCAREVACRESRDWMGRAIAAWTARLRETPRFDPEAIRNVLVSEVVDAIYGA